MAFDKVIDSAALDAGMTATANAIRKKAGRTTPIAWDSANGFKAAVEGIDTEGGVTLPALTNPATATDLALDKQLIDADGNIVMGTLYETEVGTKIFGGTGIQINGTPGSTTFNIGGIYQENHIGDNTIGFITRPGAQFWVRNAPTSLLGDATADQVVKGATFTSAAGLLVEGTHECSGGITLPTLTTPATVADVATGKEFINADGDLVTGELTEIASGVAISASDNATVAGSTSTGIRIKAQANKGDFILRNGAYLIAAAPAETFGNAAASDVAKGKTFTSAAGLQVEGTLETGTGGVHMSVDGETLVITGAVTIENETLIL